MEQLIKQLRQDYPHLQFVVGEILCWSPVREKIFYQDSATPRAISGLLHELAHARLRHETFDSDLDLLHKEVAAWEEAFELAKQYAVSISTEHAQDCLDTYRDWLHKRSTCPSCTMNGLEQQSSHYSCLNCGHSWRVSKSRGLRPYRLSKSTKKAGT